MSSWEICFQNVFLRAPQEFFVALLRLLLFLLVSLFVLLLKLWECFVWLWRTKNLYEEEIEEEDCGQIPENLIRRPDPSIYSQQYLMSQGLPVTWNNPDIWVAPASDPTAIEPDSYHLKDDTDYIASVRVHNASTDAAIGVRVRLVYRPWSFNSPEVVPVETDANGNEVVKFVDIPAMGAAIAQFNWHTPKLEAGQQKHFCLQALLSHPLDINPANNIGQENTNVYAQNPGSVAPGEVAMIEVPLFNVGRRVENFRFRWDAYTINLDDKVELKLKTVYGKVRMPVSDRLAHMLPTVSPPRRRASVPVPEPELRGIRTEAVTEPRVSVFGDVNFNTAKSSFRIVKTKYVGFEILREQILNRDYSLPPGMVITVEDGEQVGLNLQPQNMRIVTFRVQIPGDAQPGTQLPLNLIAETTDGVPAGGVTVYFQVEQ